MDYRHELKFEVSDLTLEKIKWRLDPILKLDANQKGNSYLIRSVYFDDFKDSCYRENEAGVDKRRKFRIRIYNADASYICLEKKIKDHNMTQKKSAIITKKMCDAYLDGTYKEWDDKPNSLLNEFQSELFTKHMRPKCIVEYERTAYTYPIGNIRITFDKNIRGTDQIHTFYDESINAIPVMEERHHILEVKYDEVLPSFILSVLNIEELSKQSFSKYFQVREKLKMGRML